ncbi:MAG: DUF4209 domain-containing protein [Thermoplasmata archaeon]
MVRSVVEQVIKTAKEPEVHSYWHPFAAEAKKATDAGKPDEAAKLRALSDVCMMTFRPENRREPFGPLVQTTATPGTLNDPDFATLKEFTSPDTDADLRARCADVLWVAKRDRTAADVAIEAYVESAKRLYDPKDWVEPMKRIERAYRLAAMLRDTVRREAVSDYVKELLDRHGGKDPPYFTTRLLELLVEHRDGDPNEYAPLAEKAAKTAAAQNDHRRARGLWQLAVRWHRINKNLGAEDNALLEAARTYIAEADQLASAGNRAVEAAHLSSAVTALKRARADRAEIEATHKRLLKVQGEAMKQMGGFATNIDLTKIARQARDHVKGRPLHEALFRLAFQHPIADVAELRKTIQERAAELPVQFLFPRVFMNSVGKAVAKIPSLVGGNSEEEERALEGHMIKEAAFGQRLIALGVVNPAMEIINAEHPISVLELLPYMRNNPFVPPGREWIYAKALDEGLAGHLETSLHILAPQLENSIRFVLETRGAIVTRHDDDGIQEESPLGRLMEMPEFKEAFGEDLAFDLRSILIDPIGPNFRNRIAHGLAASRELNGANALYLWWMALRLILTPFLATEEDEPPTADEIEVPEENLTDVESSGPESEVNEGAEGDA